MPFADLSDVRCYYELRGSGEPLLLIPGLGSTCRVWDCVADELSRHFTLILFDNRGVGFSTATRQPHQLRDLAVDIVELLDFLQIERSHVLGLSLGGMIAQQFAGDHPSRVDRLVLISCTNRFTTYLREIARLLEQTLRRFPRETFLRTVELLGTGPEFLDRHAGLIDEKIRIALARGVSRGAVARQMRCLAACQIIAGASPITAPTLVIASEHDVLIPACYAKRMAEEIPGSRFVLAGGCGHVSIEEKPDVVLPKIIEFLKEGQTLPENELTLRGDLVHS